MSRLRARFAEFGEGVPERGLICDFGELAKGAVLPEGCGVILLCIPMPRPHEVGQQIASLIMARDDWAGHFSVVEISRVRMRPLGR